MAGDVVVLADDDLPRQLVQTLRVEGRLQRAHFVKEHAQGPYVRLEAVRLRLDDFRREVVRRANDGLGFRLGFTEHSGNAEVSQLDHVVFSEENVLRFQISVQYLPIMNMF